MYALRTYFSCADIYAYFTSVISQEPSMLEGLCCMFREVFALLSLHFTKRCPDSLTEIPQIVSLMFFSFTSLGKSKPNDTKVHVHADTANLRLHFPHTLPARGDCGLIELFILSLLTII